ncbi:MAG: adenylate/guanylate cyclase domain-containing protein [Myxococcota bacterium]
MTQPPLKPQISLSLKLSVGLILIIVLLFASINIYTVISHRNARSRDIETMLTNLAFVFASGLAPRVGKDSVDSPVVADYLRDTFVGVREMMANDRALAFLLITRPDYSVVGGVARPDVIVFPDGEAAANEQEALERVAKLKGVLGGSMETKRFDITTEGRTKKVANLLVGVSLAQAQTQARNELIANAAALLIALALMTVYSSATLGRMVVRPLRRVMDSMLAVHDGKLDQKLELRSKDEIGVLAHTFNFMVEGLREREQLKDAFNRYVSRQVYEKLQGDQLRLSGEVRNATILFSDIRGFTSISESLDAPEVVELLNEYFTEMVEIVFRYDGFINKFIGDAMMAVYNAPLEQTHPELRAVRTAIEMQHALGRLNARRVQRNQLPIRVGIGINTGPVVAGNIGHEQRLEYTVIGDAVNLAQRIESQTKVTNAQILISEETYRVVAPHVRVQALQPVRVKGKREPVRLFAVEGLAEKPRAAAQNG